MANKAKAPKRRNTVLWAVATNDPRRFRERTVAPEKGKGRKERPRNSNRARRAYGE